MDFLRRHGEKRKMFEIVLAWEAFKDWLSTTLHLTHWHLHVVVGLVLLVLFGRLMRRPLRSFIPLAPIAVLEAINEISDFTRYYVSDWPWTPTSTAIEIALTLVPPTAVIVLAKCWPLIEEAAGSLWFRLRFPPRREHIHVRTKRQKRLK